MPQYSVDVRYSHEDDGFIAVCPELWETSAFGDTLQEAVRELEIATELVLELCEEDGRAPPDPRTWHQHSGQFRLRVPKSLHGWLVDEAAREGVSLNTFVMARLSEARGARSESLAAIPTTNPNGPHTS